MLVASRRLRSSRSVQLTGALVVLAVCGAGLPAQSPPPVQYGITSLPSFNGAAAAVYDSGEYGQALVGRAQVTGGTYHAFAQGSFGLRDLGTLGGAESAAFGSYGGWIVGQAQTASGQVRAFLVDVNATSGMMNLGTLGGSWSAAYDVRYPTVVGASRTAGDARLRAFQFVNGTMTAVAVDLGGDSVAKGVSNGGDIVGYACTAGNVSCSAFLFSGGAPIDMGLPAGQSIGNAINDRLQVAGSFTPASSGSMHAFFYDSGVVTDLGTLGGATSDGLGTNDSGHVVGTSQNSAGQPRAFLWRNGSMTDLNDLLPAGSGWVLESATAISDGGQIVGAGTLNGIRRPFLLTPPTVVTLFIGGTRSLKDSNLPRGIEVGKHVMYVTSAVGITSQPVTLYGVVMTHTLTGPAEFVSTTPQEGVSCELTPAVATCRIESLEMGGPGLEAWLRARATGPGAIAHHATLTTKVPDPNAADNSITENNRAIALSTFALTPATVAGGKISAAEITLTDQAPAGDAVVRVTSSRPDIAPVPATFTVPSWTNRRTFHITPAVVSSPTTVEISVTYGLVTLTRTLTVVPTVLRQLYLTPTTLIGGCGTSAGRILLSGVAPPGGAAVPLSNTNARASVPATVTVPAGRDSATFSVSTAAVTAPASGTVTARYGGISQSLNLTVRPIRAQTVTLSPSPARGGTLVGGTIALECPAAPGAIAVSLTSSNPSVAAPTQSSITIPAGASSGTFTVRTSSVSSETTVSVHVWVFGVRKSVTLRVSP
jgi:probable HAF family extracellular repeat protein